MAKYGEGVNYAKVQDPSSDNIVDPGLIGGKVRVMQDYISIASTSLQSTDYIVVGTKLPTGSQVVDIKISSDATSTGSGLIVVGDEGDADRYITSMGVTANYVGTGPNTSGGIYYSVTGTTDNYIRITGAGNGTVLTGSTVKISVMYVVE